MEEKVSIYELDSKGRGIARLESKPVFVFNALPEEIVEIKNVNERSKYATADVSKIFTKSEKRIEPICPHFGKCGGCDLLHLSYKDQLEFKERKVKNTITKVLKKDISISNIIPTKEFFYRNKVIFKVEEKIGFYEKETHHIIPISKCYLVDDRINEIMSIIKESVPLKNIVEIMIRKSYGTDEVMVVFKINGFVDEEKIVSILKKDVNTILIFKEEYKVLYGNGFIYEQLGDFLFKISPDSFFQVNTEGAYNLYSKVLSYVDKNDKVVDLYCGTGSIGIFISKYASSVFGVEINSSAIDDANENKRLNHLSNVNFLCLNTSMFDQNLEDIDLVIIDPPRSGLDKKTMQYLLKEEVPKMVYVSCDLMTLTRDLGYLGETYDILEITPVDMFANTYHVECVTYLRLKSK